jgi:hypothetical protein
MSIAQGLRKGHLGNPGDPRAASNKSIMLPFRRRRSTAVWPLTSQVARMPPLVGEGYGNRRDRPLVDDGEK